VILYIATFSWKEASALLATCLGNLSAFDKIRLVADDDDNGRLGELPQVINPRLH